MYAAYMLENWMVTNDAVTLKNFTESCPTCKEDLTFIIRLISGKPASEECNFLEKIYNRGLYKDM